MTAFDDVRRKRTTVMVAASLAVLVAVAGFAYAGVKALRRYEGATKVSSTSISFPFTPVAMLATVNQENVLTSITLMVLQPNAAPGGSVVSVPVSADSLLGVGDDRVPFTEVYATSGGEALAAAVESALSVTLDIWQVADPSTAATLLAPVNKITATLPVSAGDAFPSGANELTVAQAVEVLNHTEAGQSDRTRRGNVEAVWQGVAAAVGAGLGTLPAATSTSVAGVQPTFATLADFLGVLFAGPVGARPIGADVFAADLNPQGKDVERLDLGDAILVLASIAPRSMSAPAPGPVYRIEAPAGYEAQVWVAIGIILYVGGNVQSVYLNGTPVDTTELLIADPRFREQDQPTAGLFGPTKILVPDVPISGVDVIIRLGNDWLTKTDLTVPTGSTTTTGVTAPTDTTAAAPTTGA